MILEARYFLLAKINLFYLEAVTFYEMIRYTASYLKFKILRHEKIIDRPVCFPKH